MSNQITVINRTPEPILCGLYGNSVGSGVALWSGVINPGVSSGIGVATAPIYSMLYCANSSAGIIVGGAMLVGDIAPNAIVTVAIVVQQKPPS